MRKRAQAAMEFLMTYGWAILVVLAAIGALAYLGILNPQNWVEGRCDLQGDFRCGEVFRSDAGVNTDITFIFRSSTDATISGFEIDPDSDMYPDGCSGAVGTASSALNNVRIASATGANFVGPIGTGTPVSAATELTLYTRCAVNTASDQPDGFGAEITITYQKGQISQDRILTGKFVNVKTQG